jgi:hypothetical protein
VNLADLANIRLVSQQIGGSNLSTVKGVVGWMGAIQAQDYAMAKWAIGVRLPNSTDAVIQAAINNGDIIRTHLLRPTWHFVSADDVYWILELTAQQIKVSFRSRHKELGLTEAVLKKSSTVIEKALNRGMNLTREELMIELEKANIATGMNRASHLFAWAELEGLICSGASKAGKQTYALLEERVPNKKYFTKDEALAKLAKTYLTSRCPATLQDFVWWSGLSVSDAKHAADMVEPDFILETINGQTYWFTNSYSIPETGKDLVYLLPAYDEFVISYKDRSASLPFENLNIMVSNNGIFRPIIVVNGQVQGIWKRKIIKDNIIVEVDLFEQPRKISKSLIKEASLQYEQYLGKKIEMNIKF